MCDIDTSNIKKSVLKKVDDKCNLNCFKELFDFAEEYTDYEGDETGLLEKTTYTTDEDYSNDEENICDPYKDQFKKDSTKNQNDNNKSKEILETADQAIADNDSIFYDFLKNIKIVLRNAITNNDESQ